MAAKFSLADLVGRKFFKYAPVRFKYAGTYVPGILIIGVADLVYYKSLVKVDIEEDEQTARAERRL